MNASFKIILKTSHRYRYKKISESVHRLRLIGSDRGGLSGQPDRPFVVNLTKNQRPTVKSGLDFFYFLCPKRDRCMGQEKDIGVHTRLIDWQIGI